MRRPTVPRTDPELVRLIEGMALRRPRPSLAVITRRAARVAAQQGWVPVSYTTVRSIVAGLDPAMLTLAHEGVFHKNRFLCKAVSPDHAGDTIGLKDIQAARRAYRHRLRAQINERIPVVTDDLPAPVPAPPEPAPAPPPRPQLRAYQED